MVAKDSPETKKEDLNVEELISELVGEDVLDVVRKIKHKQNVSEAEIVNAVGKDVNQTRNALYKLYENSLVSFTRKKDKTKGWYIYYWTFNEDKIQNLLDTSNKEKLEKLRSRAERERNNQFFKCKNRCIRLDFDQALDFEFRCPECGELLEYDDNSVKIKEITDDIEKLEKYFEKREDEKREQAKNVMKKIKEEQQKEKELMEKEAKQKELEEKLKREEEKKRIKITPDIMILERTDPKLIDFFINMYKPFLTTAHKKDKYQYIVIEKKKVVGIMSYKLGAKDAIQIALVPSKQGKGIAKKIVNKLVKELGISKLNFIVNKSNYPNLKLVYSLGGGLVSKNIKATNLEGIVKFGEHKAPKESIVRLKEAISISKGLFKNMSKELNKRKKQKKVLLDYIKKLKAE